MEPDVVLAELPASIVEDEVTGERFATENKFVPLVSKIHLFPELEAGGRSVNLVNMKDGENKTVFNTRNWRGRKLRRILVGKPLRIDRDQGKVLGITANFMADRGPALKLIKQFSSDGGRVVVGGSDAIARPWPYLQAGAFAVVMRKDGSPNRAIIDCALNLTPREPLSGVLLADGRSFPPRRALDPNHWHLPSVEIAKLCLGREYWEGVLPWWLLPIGAVILDFGCDRECEFCATPWMIPGYRRMTPERAREWFALLKLAGARSVIISSDAFLTRILYRGGREEILEIMRAARELGLAILWGNGLELSKATLGRGLPNGDLTPDEELVQALWGWDWKKRVGCYQAYIPAERPIFGREKYPKLLPPKQHRKMLETIVRAGVPSLTYGVIVGLQDDNHKTLYQMENFIAGVYHDLKVVNPELRFVVTPFAYLPIPGTPEEAEVRKMGLLRPGEDADDSHGFYKAEVNTKYISYGEVSDWQVRLASIGDVEPHWQGVTGIVP